MDTLRWSDAEKKLTRKVFDAALTAELAQTLADFKHRAAQATTPDAMWALEDWLGARRRHIDTKYDYRYSQLILVLGTLVREGRVQIADLQGLSQEKRDRIHLITSL